MLFKNGQTVLDKYALLRIQGAETVTIKDGNQRLRFLFILFFFL